MQTVNLSQEEIAYVIQVCIQYEMAYLSNHKRPTGSRRIHFDARNSRLRRISRILTNNKSPIYDFDAYDICLALKECSNCSNTILFAGIDTLYNKLHAYHIDSIKNEPFEIYI